MLLGAQKKTKEKKEYLSSETTAIFIPVNAAKLEIFIPVDDSKLGNIYLYER